MGRLHSAKTSQPASAFFPVHPVSMLTCLDLPSILLPSTLQVQLENLTSSFQSVTEDLKKRFAVNGEPLIDESVVGSFQVRARG